MNQDVVNKIREMRLAPAPKRLEPASEETAVSRAVADTLTAVEGLMSRVEKIEEDMR